MQEIVTLKNLPYDCKEIINRFTYDKNTMNLGLIEFNKMADYEPYAGYSWYRLFLLKPDIQERLKLQRRIKK